AESLRTPESIASLPLATRSPFTIDAFEVAYQQQSEIDPRRQAWAAPRRRIESLPFLFHESVKIVFPQELIQSFIKRMARRARQGATGYPKLLLVFPPRPHRHKPILRSNILKGNCFFTFTPDC